RRLYESHFGGRKAAGLAGPEVMREVLDEAMRGAGAGLKFPAAFLKSEWDQLVDAWQLDSWELYRDVARLGRKTRLSETQRKLLWGVFERMHQALAERKLVTHAGMFTRLSRRLEEQGKAPYEFAVVDESQDIRVSQLRFLAAMGAGAPNRLFFAGDLGQRIFQQPYSWKALGVDIRGRSTTLKINYRTSHQIRMQADRLLGPDVTDVDGNVETRKGTVSVFNGPAPEVKRLASEEEEIAAVGGWLKGLEGMGPQEVGVFVRTEAQFGRAKAAVEAAGLKSQVLDEKAETRAGLVSIGTMHLAKGLEFRAVAVMACDDDVTPLKERIEQVAEESDLLEAYSTERHLLYVACTRARDRLLVTGVEPASEFLDDLEGEAL
ncbi:MAG: hypothetical protein K2Q23_07290, partial [Bryobacteraceae bacterium]|nr:hypothetical protein [Bryobacteraceae bacterium]